VTADGTGERAKAGQPERSRQLRLSQHQPPDRKGESIRPTGKLERLALLLATTTITLGISAGIAAKGAIAETSDTGSAQCDGVFHFLYVPGAENLDGSPTGIEYICQAGSPSAPLLVFMDGAGACNSGDTCDCQPDASGQCTNPNATAAASRFSRASTPNSANPRRA
jgi:hypothetical protein